MAAEAVEMLSSRKEVGKAIRPELIEIRASIRAIETRMIQIEDMYALDFGSDVDDEIMAAARLWDDCPDGRIGEADLIPIRKASPVLGTLFRKGIDIYQAYKFSAREMRLASEFGNNFNEYSDLLLALRRAKKNTTKPDEWSLLVPMQRSLQRSIGILQQQSVINIVRTLTKKGNAEQWKAIDSKYLRDDPDAKLLVVFKILDSILFQKMKGEWLNAYVYTIIRDQFNRLELSSELYTNISYRASQDMVRSASDFDVIGRFRDEVVCVECKTGQLNSDRGDFKDLIDRTKALRDVLSTMGATEINFMFFVVYDPARNDDAEMATQLVPHGITPLRPNEVRATMTRMITA